MENGWIKLHRKFLKWGWYQKSEMVHLFLHFLLLANHDEKEWQGIKIKRGQFATGLPKLSKDTGISVQTLRTCINKLKSTGEITNTSTNKYRLITITKYSDYQEVPPKLTGKSTGSLTFNQQTTNRQLTSNKKSKNKKNEKKLTSEPSSQVNELIDLFKPLNPIAYKRWFSNTTQRKAVERLAKGLGDKLEIAITTATQAQTMKYAPTITTPLQLEEKLSALRAFVIKEKAKNSKLEICRI